MSSSINSNSTAVDKFLTNFITKRLQDRNKDGQVSDEEKALFTYSDKAKALDEVMFSENNQTVSWGDVNEKLKDLQSNLEKERETSKLMYNLDTDKDGSVTYSELIAAKDTNKHAANLINLFDINVSEEYDENDVFDFSQMQNYVDLIDVDDDNDVTSSTETSSEITKFGSLVGSTRIKIGGSVQDVDSLRSIIQKFINGNSVSDLEQELIDKVKSGSYTTVAAADKTWDYSDATKLDTNNEFVTSIRQTIQEKDKNADVEVYTLDSGGSISKDDTTGAYTTTGKCVVLLKDGDGNVVAQYRLNDKTTITAEDITNLKNGTGNLVACKVGAGDDDEVGSDNYIKKLLFSGAAAVLANAEYDGSGKVLNFTSHGAKFDMAYNDDGTVTVVRSDIVGADRNTSIQTYNTNGELTTQKVFDRDGNFVKTVNYNYDGDDKQTVVSYRKDDTYPKISQNSKGEFTKVVFKTADGELNKIDISGKDVIIFENGYVKIGDSVYDSTGKSATLDTEAFQKLAAKLGDDYSIGKISNFKYDSDGNISEIEYDDKKYEFTYDANDEIETWTEKTTDKATGATTKTIHLNGTDKTISVVDQSTEIENSPQVKGTTLTFPANNNKTLPLHAGDDVTIHTNGNVEIINGSNHTVYDKDGNLLAKITSTGVTFGEGNNAISVDKPTNGEIAVDPQTGKVTIATTNGGVEKFNYDRTTGKLTSSYTCTQSSTYKENETSEGTPISISVSADREYSKNNSGKAVLANSKNCELLYQGKKVDLTGSHVKESDLTDLYVTPNSSKGTVEITLGGESGKSWIQFDAETGKWQSASIWDSTTNTWTWAEHEGNSFMITDNGFRSSKPEDAANVTKTTSQGSNIIFNSADDTKKKEVYLEADDHATINADGSVTIEKDNGTVANYNSDGVATNVRSNTGSVSFSGNKLTFKNSSGTVLKEITCQTDDIVTINQDCTVKIERGSTVINYDAKGNIKTS